MKPSSRDHQLALASPLNYAAIKSGKTKTPSKKEEKEAGAGCQAHTAFREGKGENFFLDILFYRMSVMGISQQLHGTTGREGTDEMVLRGCCALPGE
jgi:hypothetical protein